MAIVRSIKCYEPGEGEVFYSAQCDTNEGQVDAVAYSEDGAMENLKNAVKELGMEFPAVVRKSTGKGSASYEIVTTVEEVLKPEPVKEEPKEEPVKAPPAPKKKVVSKKGKK